MPRKPGVKAGLLRQIEEQKKEIARLREAVRTDDKTQTSDVISLEKRVTDARARADRIFSLLEKVIETVYEATKRGFKIPSWLMMFLPGLLAGAMAILA
jgi:hypothetical protein